MVDDDDPKSAPAPEGVPADTPEPKPDTEPEGDEPEGDTETDDEAKSAPDEDADDDASDDDDADTDDDDGEDDEGDGDKPKSKKSRAERYRRQRDAQQEALRAENEALRNRSSGSLPTDEASFNQELERRVQRAVGEQPREEDFRGDYVRYAGELQAYLADKRLAKRQEAEKLVNEIKGHHEHQAREHERMAELVQDHKDRVAKFKKTVKDFDEVMSQATVPVAPHVERLILESRKSHRIGYVLGKDQALLAKLNRSTPTEVARELGRIEGRLSLPQKPKQTQARAPIAPLKGSGARPPSQTAARDAYLKKLYGDRV